MKNALLVAALIILAAGTAAAEAPPASPVPDRFKVEGLYPGMALEEALEVLDRLGVDRQQVEHGYTFNRTLVEPHRFEDGAIKIDGDRVKRLYYIYTSEGWEYSITWLESLDRQFGIPAKHEKLTDAKGVEREIWEWLVSEMGIRVHVVRKPVVREGWKEPWWFMVEIFPLNCGCGPEPVDPGCADTDPVRIKDSYVQPDFPDEARRSRTDGKVGLWVVIERDGSISNIRVQEVSDPDMGFSEAAMRAVARWRYEPATCDGEAVAAWLYVHVSFSVHGPPQEERRKWWKRTKK